MINHIRIYERFMPFDLLDSMRVESKHYMPTPRPVNQRKNRKRKKGRKR